MASNRIEYIDIAKGILICFLCFHHFPQAMYQVGLAEGDYTLVSFTYKFYACYFMQAFFFITGFCTNFNLDFKSFLTKNIKTLVIPALCFDIITRVFGFVFTPNGNDIWGVNFRLGFWFLWTLFFCKLINYVLIRRNQRTAMFVFITILSLVMIRFATFLNFHFGEEGNLLFNQNVLVMFFFLHLGNVAGFFKEKYVKFLPIGGGIFLVLFFLNLTIDLKMPYVTAGIGDLDRAYIPHYLAFALSGTMFVLFISKLIKTNQFLEDVGKHSLLIYGFHFIILKIIVAFLSYVLNFSTITPMNTNVLFLLSCALTLITSYTFSVFVSKTKWLSFLTGKW